MLNISYEISSRATCHMNMLSGDETEISVYRFVHRKKHTQTTDRKKQTMHTPICVIRGQILIRVVSALTLADYIISWFTYYVQLISALFLVSSIWDMFLCAVFPMLVQNFQ